MSSANFGGLGCWRGLVQHPILSLECPICIGLEQFLDADCVLGWCTETLHSYVCGDSVYHGKFETVSLAFQLPDQHPQNACQNLSATIGQAHDAMVANLQSGESLNLYTYRLLAMGVDPSSV